jgi:hypothetical protein
MGRAAKALRVSAEDRAQLESMARSQSLPAALSRRSLATQTGISSTMVHRYMSLFGLQPHRSKSFKLSTDPFFFEKVRNIVGL